MRKIVAADVFIPLPRPIRRDTAPLALFENALVGAEEVDLDAVILGLSRRRTLHHPTVASSGSSTSEDGFGGGTLFDFGSDSSSSDDEESKREERKVEKRQSKDFTPERVTDISPTKKTPQRSLTGLGAGIAAGSPVVGSVSGGVAVVDRVSCRTPDGRHVELALKSPDGNEAAMSRVDSPHVVRARLEDGRLVMPWTTRGDYFRYIPKLNEFFLDSSVSNNQKMYMLANIMEQLSLGLNHIHADIEMAHMDAKPENILVYRTNTLAWTDLGSARAEGDKSTPFTPAYSPPEAFGDSFRSKLDIEDLKLRGNADSWSLGAILFRTVFGSHFFQRPVAVLDPNSELAIKKYIENDHTSTFSDHLQELMTALYPDEPAWCDFAVATINRLLIIDPRDRLCSGDVYKLAIKRLEDDAVLVEEPVIKALWRSWHPNENDGGESKVADPA